jgi:thymidylate kinase
MKGKFVVIDGIDGVGKGVFLSTLMEEAKKQNLRIFDVHDFWEQNNFHPDPNDIIGNYDVVITSEPTFVAIGKVIREEMITKNNRNYSPEAVAQAYALDRKILYQQFILPLLEAGIDVFQSRSFSTSIIYQRQSALDEGRQFTMQEIMSIPGNAFCAKHPMDFLLIPTIPNAKEALKRAEAREKDDNCEFENLDFQLKVKEHYESEEFQNFFKNLGVKLIYLDAGKTIEFSKQQAREFYQEFLT